MYCVVQNCRSVWKPNSNIKFHSFPKGSEKRNIWLSVLPIKGNFYSSAKICSLHFKPGDYDPERSGHLLNSAVPFYLPHLCDCVSTSCKDCSIEPSTSTNKPNVGMISQNTKTISQQELKENITDQPQTIPLPPNLSSGDESEVDNDDSIYERDVSPIRAEDEAEATVPDGNSGRHEGYRCDVCRGHIVGFRYACVECPNFDLCSACEAGAHHAHHYMLRVPASKLNSDVRAVVKKIREQLLKDGDIGEGKGDTVEENSIKIEIIEEDFKQEDPLEQKAEPLQGAGGQDIQYEERGTAVKVLGLSRGGGPSVLDDPLPHQPKHHIQVLSHQSRVASQKPALPQVLSHGPKILSQLLLHGPKVLSHQPAMPQVLSHRSKVLSHQPAAPQVLSHQPKVLTHKTAVLSHQPKDQSKVQSKRKVLSRQPAVPQVMSHQPAVPQVMSHQPAVPQVLSHELQIPHATSHKKRPPTVEVQGVDTVRVLAGVAGAAGESGGGDCDGEKDAGEERSYAVYTHHADPSCSLQDEDSQSEEPTSSGDESRTSRKKRKK